MQRLRPDLENQIADRPPAFLDLGRYQFSYIGVRSVYESTRFEVEFVGYDERYKVVVVGRNLGRIYALISQGRLEWIAASARDFAADGGAIILKIDVVKVEEEAGISRLDYGTVKK